MWDQEKRHLAKFNEILADNRVRPTMLLPLWNISGFLLGGQHMVSPPPPHPSHTPSSMQSTHLHIWYVRLISHKETKTIAHTKLK